MADRTARNQIPGEMTRNVEDRRRRQLERDRTRSETLGRIRSFSPQAFARDTAQGLFAGLGERFNRLNTARNVGNNRRGIFGSPIGLQAVRTDFNSRLANALAGLSMDTARLEGQNIDRMAGVARDDRGESFNTRTRELDFLSATADREQGAENFEREMKERGKDRWFSFAGDVINAAVPFFPSGGGG